MYRDILAGFQPKPDFIAANLDNHYRNAVADDDALIFLS